MKYLIFLLLLVFSINMKSQCLQANISILLDWSGSECGNEKQIVKSSLDFIESLPISENGVRMSVKTFSFNSFYSEHNYMNIVTMTHNRDELNDGVSWLLGFPASGGTLLSDGITSTMIEFQNNYRGDNIPNVVIIISDGEIYDLSESSELIRLYETKMLLNIFAIQIGGDSEGFKNLTELTGNSNNIEVSSVNELIDAFKKLNLCN